VLKAPDYVAEIRKYLTPDLLSPKLRKEWKPGYPLGWGHCYVATETLYYLWGRDSGFKACYYTIEGYPTHWFLRSPKGETTVDPTWDQFPFKFPYWAGVGCGFLTFSPSKRTKILLTRMGYAKLVNNCQVMRGNV
jgi:hypothetical protein